MFLKRFLIGKMKISSRSRSRIRIYRYRRRIKSPTKPNRADYIANKDKAYELVMTKLAEFNQIYNFKYNKVSIKNQKTRWGSCSSKSNLNFSYKIALIPEHLVNYLIVHELCHLGEFNHSQKFWSLVARTIPDYKNSRKELRSFQVNTTSIETKHVH